MQVSMTVNGQQRTDEVEPRMLLAHHLRDNLGLTATNIGCDSTSCGEDDPQNGRGRNGRRSSDRSRDMEWSLRSELRSELRLHGCCCDDARKCGLLFDPDRS